MACAEFLNVWQFVEIAQTEMVEKKFGRFVKQRTTGNLGASRNFDEAALHQRLQNAIDGDAAHCFDIGAGDGLAISDDSERLERGRTQTRRFRRRGKAANPFGVFWI